MSGLVKSTLEYFGFGSSEAATYPSSSAPSARQSSPVRPVSALRSTRRGAGDVTEIATMQPRGYEEAPLIAARFRDGVPVIVNMGEMSEADCRRMLDFLAGLKEGLEGHIKRVTQKVFLLSPANVYIDEEDDMPVVDSSDDLVIRPFN